MGFSNAYSIHSVVPFRGHQSKYEDGSSDDEGSSPSWIGSGFFRPDVVTLLAVAIVGNGAGLPAAPVRAIQTAIWPRPRFAHVE